MKELFTPHITMIGDTFDPLSITWTMTTSNGDVCDSIPATTHRVYVTLGTPNPAPLFETVMDIGCKNAIGKATEGDAVAAVWNEFTDRDVRRKATDGFNNGDGVQMKYWNPPASSCQTMEAMLAHIIGNGTCVAWANLLHHVLKAQGITASVVHEVTTIYTDDPLLGGGRGVMLVKNWSFGPVGSAPIGCTPFTHLSTESTDLLGAPAQGNMDPPGGFFNHFIVRYSSEWYDPSYGNGPFSTDDAWENASIDGYGRGCASAPPPGGVRKTNDPLLIEMQFSP